MSGTNSGKHSRGSISSCGSCTTATSSISSRFEIVFRGILLAGGFLPQILQELLQALDDDPFVLGEFAGRKFQREGFVVLYGSQVIQEAGQGEDAAAGDKVLPAVTIIGEVNVPDPAAAVIEIE